MFKFLIKKSVKSIKWQVNSINQELSTFPDINICGLIVPLPNKSVRKCV